MTGTTAKIVLAVGLTALFTAMILIAAFVGFLYFRPTPEISGIPISSPGPTSGRETPGRRPKGPVTVAADQITEIRLQRSSMASTAPPKPAAYFSNINVQNFVSSTAEWTFASDGTARKVISDEQTQNGVKTQSGPTTYAVSIGRDKFEELANILVANDFANEPDSKNITSLPASVTLTVTHTGGVKVIKASNMGSDTPELSAIIIAIAELDKKIDWAAGKQ